MNSVKEMGNTSILKLASRVFSYAYRNSFRHIAPVKSAVKYSGIAIGRDRKYGDFLIPSTLARLRDVPDYEAALVAGLTEHVHANDTVVVVGGGWGVTAVTAARAAPHGQVTCFEGSDVGVKRVRETAIRNGVASRITVHHAIVGQAISVYGTGLGRVVLASELPKCDVLELDCEGAELGILRSMTITPRVILVETHGIHGASSQSVNALLEERGYQVRDLGIAEPGKAELCLKNDIRVLVGVSPDKATDA